MTGKVLKLPFDLLDFPFMSIMRASDGQFVAQPTVLLFTFVGCLLVSFLAFDELVRLSDFLVRRECFSISSA